MAGADSLAIPAACDLWPAVADGRWADIKICIPRLLSCVDLQ